MFFVPSVPFLLAALRAGEHCSPPGCSSQSAAKSGNCVALKDIDRLCTNSGWEASKSADCATVPGSWCCYDPKNALGTCAKSANEWDVKIAKKAASLSKQKKFNRLAAVNKHPPHGSFLNMNQRVSNFTVPTCSNVDSPFLLTQLIQSGQIQAAQTRAKVISPAFPGQIASYSGFLTVNQSDNSNMFFWFFEAEVSAPATAPVVVWLNGGPGASSLFGLLVGHGPYRVDADGNLFLHEQRWTKVANVLFIDNPVETGFSFTSSEAALATTEEQVAANLYEAIVQFYTMFPQYQTGELYFFGESYAGKYVPAIAYKIHVENSYHAKLKLPLKGIGLGNAFVDPVEQTLYAEMLYQLGLITFKERAGLLAYEAETVQLINDGKFVEAAILCDEIFEYFDNTTHIYNLFNYLTDVYPPDQDNFYLALARCDIRQALHVGNLPFKDLNDAPYAALLGDILRSVKPWLTVLIDNYRVIVYNGVLDVICNEAATENYLSKMTWKGVDVFNAMDKVYWKINENDDVLAGYAREVGNFTHVAIRNSGHEVTYDKPEAALDLLTRFLQKRSFNTPGA